VPRSPGRGGTDARRRRGAIAIALGCLTVGVLAGGATSAPGAPKDSLHGYAVDTWESFVAMTDPESGLPTDILREDGTRSVQTSTTNIGAYLWSTVGAERLGIIDHDEAVSRLERTVSTLEGMERHDESGQFYNWYDHRTGEKLTVWPPSGGPHEPRISSVDNGWLATGLAIVRNAVPELADRAGDLYDSMDFGFYYVPETNQILFHYEPRTGNAPCCYNTIVSESRIASYIGIAKGELPPKHYFGAFRSFTDSCDDRPWQETRPIGSTRDYYGVSVFEGAYPYKDSAGSDTLVTPAWGGSMFEALMPALFLPEDAWAPGSWRSNHPLTVEGQIHHGLDEAQYGYWGFSPANVPEGGYRTYGVDALGMDPGGYPSNNDATLVDRGFPGCPDREPTPDPPPSAYTNGVVTPHAAFLGLRFAPAAAEANLSALARDFDGLYTDLGFLDSVNVDSGVVSDSYLSLDQGMVMAALANALGDDVLRKAFATNEMKRMLRPVMAVEEFNVHPRGCTITGTAEGDVLRGTSRDDVICALGGDDVVIAAKGADIVFGDAGADRVQAGDGDDTAYGGEGDDVLVGGRDWDVLSGGPGDDHLAGGPGPDHHEGGAGSNSCDLESSGDTANACGD
jgi:Putative glucoamylase/Protein of unknown function (DUF3131)/RTX calcium-binding nonapeptide repeat (4 copies)